MELIKVSDILKYKPCQEGLDRLNSWNKSSEITLKDVYINHPLEEFIWFLQCTTSETKNNFQEISNASFTYLENLAQNAPLSKGLRCQDKILPWDMWDLVRQARKWNKQEDMKEFIKSKIEENFNNK